MFNGNRIAYGHVCEQGYDKPKTSDRCDLLGDTVSLKMDVLGAVFVHEYAHFHRIGMAAVYVPSTRCILSDDTNASASGLPILDQAYGPLGTRNLAGPAKLYNADNYRWLALEYYWTTFCGRTFSGPRELDETDDACLPGRCVVQ